jgi:ribosome maturation factor RimP
MEDQAVALAESLGFSLVEFSASSPKGAMAIAAVIYAPGGIGIAECSRYHKALLPRLEALQENRDISLTVSSPGLDRHIKQKREYRIFVGRGVKVYSRKDNEWHGGIIQDADDNKMTLKTKNGTETVDLADVQKARLDYKEEAC